MAGGVSRLIIVLEVRNETIHLDVAVHCEIEISAVVDLGICVLKKQLNVPRRGEVRWRARSGGGEISADVNGNISTRADVALVRDGETRKLSSRIVGVIACDVEREISSAGDGGAGQNHCV